MTMLDRMRRHKNWLKWSLALVVLTFVLFYIPDFLSTTDAVGGTATTGRVARVGSRDITGNDFRNRYQLQLQAYSNAYGGNLTDQMLRQLQIEQQILQQMIEERVQLAEADRLGLTATDEEVRGRILAMPGLQENGQFIGEARYRELLRVQRPPLTPRQFEEQIRNALVLEKLRATLTGWISLTDQELQQEYRRRNEKVKLQIVSLPINGFDSQVTVPDSELTATFESNKEKYRIAERRKIRYMLLDLETARAKATVTDAQVQAEYNRRSPEYTTQEEIRASHILLRTEGKKEEEVRAAAEDVLKQARGGADFAGLAKKYLRRRSQPRPRGRSRLLCQGTNGPRVRGSRVQTGARANQRPRQNPVRLSHHQGQRQESWISEVVGRRAPTAHGTAPSRRRGPAAW